VAPFSEHGVDRVKTHHRGKYYKGCLSALGSEVLREVFLFDIVRTHTHSRPTTVPGPQSCQ